MNQTTPSVLAVIPARYGSKGVPLKNIRPFAGSSLLAITIDTAHRAKAIHHTIVSTDSKKIAAHAQSCGGNVPFLRPPHLADDQATALEVSRHAALWYAAHTKVRPDIVVTLQPTSPLRTAHHLDTAVGMLRDSRADAVVGVTEAEHTPYKMYTLGNGHLQPLFGSNNVGQRQDAPVVYRLNGIVYATRWETLVEQHSFFGTKALPYLLPESVAFNIDTMLEFSLAEWLYSSAQAAADDTADQPQSCAS